MKKVGLISFIVCSLLVVSTANAQQSENLSFFNKQGIVNIQTVEKAAINDSVTLIDHRVDDIVWSRVIYRVIDMREIQNYQLYFPVVPQNQYKSLFRVMLESLVSGELKAYGKIDREMLPDYYNAIPQDSLPYVFTMAERDTFNNQIVKNSLIEMNPITRQLSISDFAYEAYVSNQFKFLTQEIVFFNKHFSRMYSKIMAIAPLYANTETNVVLGEMNDRWDYFKGSILCWIYFDELRPYLRKQIMIPNGNNSQLLTYDDFFAQKYYFSYILGDQNLTSRMLLQLYADPEEVRKEQKRISDEILNFEMDLWEN